MSDVSESEASPVPKKTRTAAEAAAQDLLASVNLAFVAQPVVPGDDVTAVLQGPGKRVKLGGGLVQQPAVASGSGGGGVGAIKAVRAGTLRYAAPATYWVESGAMKRYVPRAEDSVIGVVEDRSTLGYRVGISGTMPGSLPLLAFEGATKRTKPSLKVGDAVYVRVVSAPKDMEPELSCVSVCGPRKGWETKEATFGPLEGGALLRCSLAQAATLRTHDHPVLKALKDEGAAFEVVVGANGVVWAKAATARLTVCVDNALQNALVLRPEECAPMVKELFARLKAKAAQGQAEENQAGAAAAPATSISAKAPVPGGAARR
jgi:exosome complex component RRP40